MFKKKKIYVIGIIVSVILLLGSGASFFLPRMGMGGGMRSGMMEGGFDPENMPEDFDMESMMENMPEGFQGRMGENMPEGFSAENMRGNMQLIQTIRMVVLAAGLILLAVSTVMLLRISKKEKGNRNMEAESVHEKNGSEENEIEQE